MGKKKVNDEVVDSNEPIKKQKLFSAKEFRKQLNIDGLTSLKHFLQVIKDSESDDYIFDYLETGGNCLELLHTLEVDSSIPPAIVFDIITVILLKINTFYPQYQSSAYEACRYILNNYITVLNKMINLSSTTPERKSCLKLLTAMVTFSPVLAKDILIHVNFHSTNVELLTKHTGEKDSTRDNFIKFLTAYLVDGHYPALSVLLEKKGFFTSIISGLKFDAAETLCLVISAMKNFILENPSVSKTAKMKTFNTIVVRDIVNLYNWKGPEGFRAEKKKSASITVNEVEKSKVNESVHDFLLILCTNHKAGVIFKDHLVGLGKKNQNALMYTVLESLDRPWEHSYASELVIKICKACPDLAKTIWTNLKVFLEPRLSQKWINALKFALNLIKELQPNCIEYCIKDLNDIQLFQIVQCIVLPLPILKTILPENGVYETPAVKQYILSFLLEMLKTIQQYIICSKLHLQSEKHDKFKLLLNKHVSKHFPNAVAVLSNWEDTDENSPFSSTQILEIIFDILNHYKNLASDLLEPLNNIDTELSDLLTKIEQLQESDVSLDTLQVKIINVFVDLDQTNFATHSKMFQFVIPSLLKIYYNNTNAITLSVLQKLFKNTGIFDGCLYEINIWINGILDLKHFDKSIADVIVKLLNITNENILQFLQDLSLIQTETGRGKYYNDIIENLMLQTEFSRDFHHQSIKHRYLSPMILGLFSYLATNEVSKSLKIYVNFVVMNLLHSSTQIGPIINLINKSDALSAPFKQYAESWVLAKDVLCLSKTKGRLHIFQDFSEKFLAGEVDTFINNNDLDLYLDLQLNLLDTSLFYLTNFLNNDLLQVNIIESYETFVKNIIKRNETNTQFIERILSHPVLLYHINFLDISKQNSQGYATKCLTNITAFLLKEGYNIECYLNVYRQKLLNSVLKILNKPQKFEQLSLDLKVLLQMYGLGYIECINILKTLSETYQKHSPHDLILDIFSYSLKQFINLCVTDTKLKPLDDGTCAGLTAYLISLAKNQQNISPLSPVFYHYFNKFPHSVSHLDQNLFKVLLDLEELNKDNVKLAAFLLEKNPSYVKYIRKRLNSVCEKKGLLLPLLAVLSRQEIDNELMLQIYDLTVTSLNKTLQKPQKVGLHFHENYQGLIMLINNAMPVKNCHQFFDKVQKFDVTEVFHTHLLKTICLKVLDSSTSKEINNVLLTFIHLQTNLFKRALKFETEITKAIDVSQIFVELLKKIKMIKVKDLTSTAKNETAKLYFKFCLKYGVSKQPIFLQALRLLIEVLGSFLEIEDGRLVLEMLTSHSEFLEIVLGEHCETKTEIFSTYLVLCKMWPEFMERQFVPLLLASYRALVNKCDRTILLLLRMYESNSEQTNFYDFKPFLWGKAAATHYSVKQQLRNALWREPKTSDVLDILQDNLVHSTITNYPLKEGLGSIIENEMLDVNDIRSYDLTFLLPLFSQLLAPEQNIQTYKFTRSGALSLTVIALSSANEETRKAAFHVLARLHYHVDARQTGKDNLLWIRYIEAVCKSIILLPEYKLNNFAAVYLARMALILTQPNHVMYLPLSQHLAAKLSLDFSTVPELYTFLHSSDVNFKEHRIFTLELLRDGLRTEKDFLDFMRSMAFKLFSELYSSVVSDSDTRLLILDVVKAVCEIPLGVKVICENYSFMAQLASDFNSLLKDNSKERSKSLVVDKILEIIVRILKVVQSRHLCFRVYSIIRNLIFSEFYNLLVENCEQILFEILVLLQNAFPIMFSKEFYNTLLNKVDDPVCKYIDKYGCDFLNVNDEITEQKYVSLRSFVVNYKKQNVSCS